MGDVEHGFAHDRLVHLGGTDLPLDEIEPGMTVRVFAGERLPVDGTVENGLSDVDRSLVTGESLPTEKQPGALSTTVRQTPEQAIEAPRSMDSVA